MNWILSNVFIPNFISFIISFAAFLIHHLSLDIDLNDSEAVWKKLTEKERQEFRQLVNSGSFDDLLPPWSPWWEQEVPPVQEISQGHQIVPAYVAKCPPLVDVPLLSQVMVR